MPAGCAFRVYGGGNPGVFAFEAVPEGGIVGVFEPESRETFAFDRDVMLVNRVQITSGLPEGKEHWQRGEIRRTAVRRLEEPVVKKLAAAAKEYDWALAAYKGAVGARAAGAKGPEAVNGARGRWRRRAGGWWMWCLWMAGRASRI